MKAFLPVLSLLVLGLGLGACAKAKEPASTAKSDIVERMFAGRAVGHGFRPAGVAQAIADAAASTDSSVRADSVTPLAVWIELRKAEEGALLGVWTGDTTLVQIAGGTGLRGYARPGEAGSDLLRLAKDEPELYASAADDLAPPPDGVARVWVITAAGVRRHDEPVETFLDPERKSTPFLQEARLFTRTVLGNAIEYEKDTSHTLESLGVTPEHTAEKLARAVGIDPEAEH
jgi:hypothetical protein